MSDESKWLVFGVVFVVALAFCNAGIFEKSDQQQCVAVCGARGSTYSSTGGVYKCICGPAPMGSAP